MSPSQTLALSRIQNYLRLDAVAEVFFEDGNLVIQARQKVFKVYRGILLAQSRSVPFRELLSGPARKRRKGDPEYFEGATVIHLPDNPKELEHFLKAIFHANYFPPVPYRTTTQVLIGVLRLSVKYDVPTLRTRALQHLSTAFPTSLSSLSLYESARWTFDINDSAERVALTEVAHEVGAYWALPIGLLKISYLLSFDELYGNDSSHPLPSHCDQVEEDDTLTARPLLQQEHRRVCLKMHSLHSKHCFDVTSFLLGEDSFSTPCPGCSSPERCARNRHQWLTTIQRMTLLSEPRINPFYIWPDEFWGPYGSNICQSCLDRDMQIHRERLGELWKDLPILLELPDWDTLREMKKDDLAP